MEAGALGGQEKVTDYYCARCARLARRLTARGGLISGPSSQLPNGESARRRALNFQTVEGPAG